MCCRQAPLLLNAPSCQSQHCASLVGARTVALPLPVSVTSSVANLVLTHRRQCQLEVDCHHHCNFTTTFFNRSMVEDGSFYFYFFLWASVRRTNVRSYAVQCALEGAIEVLSSRDIRKVSCQAVELPLTWPIVCMPSLHTCRLHFFSDVVLTKVRLAATICRAELM